MWMCNEMMCNVCLTAFVGHLLHILFPLPHELRKYKNIELTNVRDL